MSSMADLRPLPWTERLFMRRAFQGEEIRLGPPQRWLGRSWDLRLASVRDVIYKVAFEASASSRADAEDLSAAVLSELEKILGHYTQPGDAIFAWDATDGNAVLQFANVGGERRIMLFLTSSIVRTFTR
jgi:hypothetical protein